MGVEILKGNKPYAFEVTILIPVFGNHDLLKECLFSIRNAQDSSNTLILIWSDGDSVTKISESISEVVSIYPEKIEIIGTESNKGYTKSVNSGVSVINTEYAVIVNSDVQVFEGWLQGIGEAFSQYDHVGTVSVLSNAGSIYSVPFRNSSVAEFPVVRWNAEISKALRNLSKKLFPIVPTPVGHVLGIDVKKWNELNGFDEIFSPGYGEESDLGERMCMRGYLNVLADNVWVTHKKSASFGNDDSVLKLRAAHEEIIQERHSAYLEKASIGASSEKTALAKVIQDSHLVFFGVSDSGVAQTLFNEELQEAQSVCRAIYSVEPRSIKTVRTSRIAIDDFNIAQSDILILLVDQLSSIENQYGDLNDGLWRSRREKTLFLFERASCIVWSSEYEYIKGRGIVGETSHTTNLIHSQNTDLFQPLKSKVWVLHHLQLELFHSETMGPYIVKCKDCADLFCNHTIAAAVVLSKTISINTNLVQNLEFKNSYERQLDNSGRFGKFALMIFSKHPQINRSLLPIGSRRRLLIRSIVLYVFLLYRKVRKI